MKKAFLLRVLKERRRRRRTSIAKFHFTCY